MSSNPEKHILDSWHSNAAAWTNAIEQQTIESRRLITNKAIVDAISEQGKPAFALPEVAQIVMHLVPELREGDVVAIMSNGGFGGIHEKILSALQSK